jgi:predicted transcriptional regulator
MFILSEEKADPRGTIELVARADVKVAIKRLNVDGLMHRTLTAVNENLSASGCASRMISESGVMVPSTLDICVTATSFVLGVRSL